MILYIERLERMFQGNGGFILDVEEGVVLHDNGCWEEMKRRFLYRKKLGAIKKMKKWVEDEG